MKKRITLIAGFILAFVAVFTACSAYAADVSDILASLVSVSGTALAGLPIWIVAKAGKEEFQEITMEQFDKLAPEEQLSYHKAFAEHRKQQVDKLKADIEALKKKEGDNTDSIAKLQEDLRKADLSRVDSLEKMVETQGLTLAKLLGNSNEVPKTVTEQIHKFIQDNSAKIEEIKNAGSGVIEFVPKAVGAMTTGSATLPVAAPALVGTQDAPATNVNLRGTVIDSVVSRFSTNLAAYPYTESVPKDGDYSFVAEGGSKPQVDLKIETRWAKPVKVAAHMVLTDESVTDIAGLQSIATDYLRRKHDLKREQGLLFGDGVGANLKGLTVYGRTFVAGSMALAVANPNIMDIINACITDIATTNNYEDETPYMANIVMLSYEDFFVNFCSAKTADGVPLYPTATLFGQVRIGGVLIMPYPKMPAGKILVADASVYRVSNYVPYSIKLGWINDQLITNQFTMVGESRFHAFVRTLDEAGIIYDDIDTIKTAIATV